MRTHRVSPRKLSSIASAAWNNKEMELSWVTVNHICTKNVNQIQIEVIMHSNLGMEKEAFNCLSFIVARWRGRYWQRRDIVRETLWGRSQDVSFIITWFYDIGDFFYFDVTIFIDSYYIRFSMENNLKLNNCRTFFYIKRERGRQLWKIDLRLVCKMKEMNACNLFCIENKQIRK